MKRNFMILGMMLLLMTSCNGAGGGGRTLADIEGEAVLAVDESKDISVPGATYASDREKVAAVDEKGVITAVNYGDAVITVTLGEEVRKVRVFVRADIGAMYGFENGTRVIFDAYFIGYQKNKPIAETKYKLSFFGSGTNAISVFEVPNAMSEEFDASIPVAYTINGAYEVYNGCGQIGKDASVTRIEGRQLLPAPYVDDLSLNGVNDLKVVNLNRKVRVDGTIKETIEPDKHQNVKFAVVLKDGTALQAYVNSDLIEPGDLITLIEALTAPDAAGKPISLTGFLSYYVPSSTQQGDNPDFFQLIALRPISA